MYGLDNLVLVCAETESPAQLQAAVDRHVDCILTTLSSDTLTREQTLAALRLRLIPAYQAVPDEPDTSQPDPLARPFADRFAEAIVLDTPTAVITPGRDALLAHAPIEELVHVARANSWQELSTTPVEEFRTGGQYDDYAYSVLGDSYFIATAGLFLPELLSRWQPGIDLSRGVLFAQPHRHRVLFRAVDTPESVIEGLPVMAQLAASGYDTEPGHVSPLCYLWHRGEVTAVSDVRHGQTVSELPSIRLVLDDHLESIVGL